MKSHVPNLYLKLHIECTSSVSIVLEYACEQATFFPLRVEFENVLMSMLISIPGFGSSQNLISFTSIKPLGFNVLN